MANSVKVDSYPIKVRFAGWESDTWTLQRAGWQIAASQVPEPWNAKAWSKIMNSSTPIKTAMYIDSYTVADSLTVLTQQWRSRAQSGGGWKREHA